MTRRVRSLALVVAATVAAAGCGAGKSTPRPLVRPQLDTARELHLEVVPTTHTLPNGLRVVLLADSSSNLVSVDMRYQVGKLEDPPDKPGLAHLVEHMMFELGPGRPALKDRLAQVALTFNAYTTWDETHYTALALRDRLPDMIALEAERMAATCNRFDPVVFAREREVIRSELRQRSGVGTAVNDLLRRLGYGTEHPYARPFDASAASLDELTLDDVCGFIERYYAPERAVLVVTGNFDPDAAKTAAGDAFAAIMPRRTPARPNVPPIALTMGASKHTLPVKRAAAYIITAAPVFTDREGTYDDSLRELFEAHILYKLRKLDYVSSVGVQRLGGERAPLNVASVIVTDPARVKDAVDAFFAARDEFAKEMADFEVPRQAERNAAALLRRYESISSRGVLLADYVQYGYGVLDIATHVAWLRGVSLRGMGRRSVNYFSRAKSHVAVVTPDDPDEALEDEVTAGGARYDVQSYEVPVDGDEHLRDLALPAEHMKADVRRFTLDNGMRVMLAPSLEYPLVDIRLVFPVGSLHDPADKPGLAEMTAHLLAPNYAPGYSYADQLFLRAILAMGGDLSVDVSEKYTTFRTRGLAMHTDGLLWQLGWLLDRGKLTKDTLANYRKILARNDDDDARRSRVRVRAIGTALFGAGHPYVQAASALEQAKHVHLDDLRKFRRANYHPTNAVLVVSGNFYPPDIEQRIRDQYGKWKSRAAAGPPARRVPPAARRSAAVHFGHEDDDTSQVWIAIAFATPPGTANRAAREVVEEMLRARMESLREELASTYGIGVAQLYSSGPGLIMIRGAIDKARGGEALVAMRAVLDSLRRGDDAAAVFARARRVVFRRSLAQSMAAGVVASHLVEVALGKRKLDDYTAEAADVAKLRLPDVQRVIDTALSDRASVVFVSGSRKAIDATYAAAGIRDVEYLE